MDKNLIDFLLTFVFAFLIGLEVRVYRESFHKKENFGSVRTFTLSGILGFVLFKISTFSFITGLIIISVLYAIHYIDKINQNNHSILLLLVLLITYSIGAIISKYPIWLSASIFVVIIFILNKKQTFYLFSKKIDLKELETFGKMILLSVVILPILPKTKLPYIEISPFKIWFIVVIVSLISYLGYILQKYIFADKGFFLTGIAGGTYSSTATTVVLASKARTNCIPSITAGIIVATGVMYIRILVISYIFNTSVAQKLTLPTILFFIISLTISLFFIKDQKKQKIEYLDINPLELKTAFIFAALFIIMMAITKFVKANFGNIGLEWLSFIIGFTDIDPFILSIISNNINASFAAKIILISVASNNFLKAFYAYIFSNKLCKESTIILIILGILTLFYAYFAL